MQTRAASDSPLEMLGSLWRRRKWLGILTFIAVFAAVASLIAGLPDLYRSTAVVVVDTPISENFARSSISAELEPRLQMLSQEIMSRTRLLDLIGRYNLYPELRERVSPDVLVERMRKDIRLDRKEVAQPSSGRGVTTGFSLSYQGWDPDVTAEVTNTLASFYSNENQKIRQRQAADTTALLKERLEESKRRLDAAAAGIRIPESAPLVFSDPSIDRINRSRQDQFDRLTKMKQELAELRTHYGEKYPDVIRLRAEIEGAESRMRTDGLAQPDGKLVPPPASDPTRDALRRELELQQRLPRDYAALKDVHASLLKRYEDAQLAEALEKHKGENFRIVDVALPGTEPSAPARQRFLLMGLVAALAFAAAAMIVAERLDTSFRRLDELRSFAQLPILASIPRIVTAADVWRGRARVAAVMVVFVLTIVVVARGAYELGQAGEQLVWMFAQRSA